MSIFSEVLREREAERQQGIQAEPEVEQLPIVNALIKLGGREWKTEDGEKHRVYFKNIREFYGLSCEFYKSSGRVSSATLNGDKISNNTANKLCTYLDLAGLYYDVNEGAFYSPKLDEDDFQVITSEITRRANELM